MKSLRLYMTCNELSPVSRTLTFHRRLLLVVEVQQFLEKRRRPDIKQQTQATTLWPVVYLATRGSWTNNKVERSTRPPIPALFFPCSPFPFPFLLTPSRPFVPLLSTLTYSQPFPSPSPSLPPL